jgi:hypothetical protein
MQRPHAVAAGELLVPRARLGEQRVAILKGDNRVDMRVERRNVIEISPHDLDTGDDARMEGRGEVPWRRAGRCR